MSVSEIIHHALQGRLRQALNYVEESVQWAVKEGGMALHEAEAHVGDAIIASGGVLGSVLFGRLGAVAPVIEGAVAAVVKRFACAVHGGDCAGDGLGCQKVHRDYKVKPEPEQTTPTE